MGLDPIVNIGAFSRSMAVPGGRAPGQEWDAGVARKKGGITHRIHSQAVCGGVEGGPWWWPAPGI